MRIILRIVGLVGVLIFGASFYFTYGVPGGVEEIAKDFVKERIEEETREKIDSISLAASESTLGKIALKMMKGREKEIDELKLKLQEKAYEKSAAVIAEMRDLSCECRIKYAERLKENMEFRISGLEAMNEKLLGFMKSKYMEVVNKLTQDLRIFTGSNLAMFAFLLLASFLKPKAVIQLFVPGILLAASTIICSYFYLFEQNWFLTIIYSDFIGFGYLAYVGGLFLWFCDIIFNKARVTTEIVNMVLNAIGSALQAVPC